jgi:outer membrane protein assembly factor BamA
MPAGNAHRVRLTYHIVEGPPVQVARVLMGGYEHTRAGVIQREVQVKAGGPLREGEVLETQRRLYNLGVFSRVSIAPQNPAGTDPAKTVVVLMEEAKRYTLGYGFGFEVQRLGGAGASPVGGELRASPRGILEITKANLTRRADTLSFKVRASTLQGRALVSYTEPNFFSRPAFSLQLTGFADKSRDIRTFTSTRYEGSVQLAQRLSLVTSLLYRYSFRRVLAGSLQISSDKIPLFSQPTRVSSVGVTWFRERRNNPADATRGDFTNVDLSIAGKPIGSSASFIRLVMQNSTFHPLGRRFIFARSLRFGVQTPIGNTLSTEIPLPERFFAGGGNSLRGFGLNQAGPRDPTTGFPIGGQAMLIFNQELRFPMRLPFVGTRLGGALFYDAGNVFRSVRRITLRPSVPPPVLSAAAPTAPATCLFNCTNG